MSLTAGERTGRSRSIYTASRRIYSVASANSHKRDADAATSADRKEKSQSEIIKSGLSGLYQYRSIIGAEGGSQLTISASETRMAWSSQ